MKISFQTSVTQTECFIAFIPKKGFSQKNTSDTLLKVSTKLIKDKIFKGEKSEVLFLPCTNVGKSKHLLLVGLGDTNSINKEDLRQITASAYKKLEMHGISNAVIDLSLSTPFFKKNSDVVNGVTEGLMLANYQLNELKQKSNTLKPVSQIYLSGVKVSAELKTHLEQSKALAESINFSRWLADLPANFMTPPILAKEVQKKFKGLKGIQVTIWDKKRIQKEKMGGLLGVSLGSNQDPRVIIIKYTGISNAKSKVRPLCFVGKGLTFDSGGISIKPAQNMDSMKFDMCGATAVIGSLLAMARLKLKVNVIGLVGSTENMLGAGATKPGDILKARNGKTMEVLNTDAEGRLVLADMLSYASEQKPEFIIDTATLTGAVVVALGNVYTGIFTRNQKIEKQIKQASVLAGEQMWSLPLDNFHVSDIKSNIADVANISSSYMAGSSTAAAFLEHFVDKKIMWAHLDIAGTADNVANRLPYCRPKSASGVMVRTFVELAKQYAR